MENGDSDQLEKNAHHDWSQFVKVETEHDLFHKEIHCHQDASEYERGSHPGKLPISLRGLLGRAILQLAVLPENGADEYQVG